MKKRLLSLLLAALLLASLTPLEALPAAAAEAYSGTCGPKLTWSFNQATGLLTITGSGDMDNWTDYESTPWAKFHRGIRALSLPQGLTSVGCMAFMDCTGLTSVTVPAGVTKIEGQAFSSCTGLKSISLPDSVTELEYGAFLYCSSLTSLTLPKKLTCIQPALCGACLNLERVTLPPLVQEIRTAAFMDCSSLTGLNLPAGLMEIHDGAFLGCEGLTQLTIPEKVTYLGIGAFAECSGLTQVTVPGSVTVMGDRVFQGCSSLKTLRLEEGLRRIGSRAFEGCRSLEQVSLPFSLSFVGCGAFCDCDSLRSVAIHNPACYVSVQATVDYGDPQMQDLDLSGNEAPTLGSPRRTIVCGPTIPKLRPEPTKSMDFHWNAYSLDRTTGEWKCYGVDETDSCSFLWDYLSDYDYQRYHLGLFEDVEAGKFYEVPASWAIEEGITEGTGEGLFSPDKECTRAQVVTFLWRAAGKPEPQNPKNRFTDVPAGKSYTTAVLWAVEQGITKGTSDTTFSPNKACTRAQVVTFLWRYLGTPSPGSQTNPFSDVKADSSYAKAILWAVAMGITNGTSDTTFSPNKTCTRGQVVTFLFRALN